MRDCTKIMVCYNFEYIERRGKLKMKKFIEEIKTFALRGNVMVNFIIMVFILFCLMKGINKLGRTDIERRGTGRTDHENLSLLSE